MYTGGSLLLSGISILAFSSIGFAHRIACNIQSDFTVDLTNDERAIFYGSDLTIKLNDDALVVNSYRRTSFHIWTKENIVVQFKGYLAFNDKGSSVVTEPERISQTYMDRISGMAELAPYNSTDFKISHCRLVLLPIEMDGFKVHYRIANKIQQLAESCLELEICPRIDEIAERKEHESPNRVSKDKTPVGNAADAWKYFNPYGCEEKVYSETIQLAINKVVDVGLNDVIANMVKTNDGSIAIPNIDKSIPVSLGFIKTTAHFEAVEGTFRDLTTIRRTVDATLSHDGMKFMASCEFGLTLADIKFNHYKLTYTPVKVNGKLSGRIDGAALKARIAVDYNRTPCFVSVEYLNVTEFGKMTVDLTGLGALSDVTSKLINWITKTWRDDIIYTIETEMRATIESQLSNLDCEKFRP